MTQVYCAGHLHAGEEHLQVKNPSCIMFDDGTYSSLKGTSL